MLNLIYKSLNDRRFRNNKSRIHILRNRGKHVSSEIDDDALLKKVKYLKKRDVIHLATIRGLVFNKSSLESMLDDLFKDIHK